MTRARTVRPDFQLTPANVRAIAQICIRLDGLPLAIELAASRVRLLPPEALLVRLGRSLDLLGSAAADRTDRQRTLRGAIDWSYELLEAPARLVFRRLSVFVGGWGLEDAEAVVAAEGGLDGGPVRRAGRAGRPEPRAPGRPGGRASIRDAGDHPRVRPRAARGGR